MKRRTFILGASATTSGWVWPAFAQTRGRTPGQIVGPYYPVVKPSESDIDLTRMSDRPGRAAGEVIRVIGRVYDEAGQPVPNAEIEIWQADARGRYPHPSDKTAGTADPNFQGYAVFASDAEGRYQFTSIKPGPYPDDGGGSMRAPHIHFQVTGRLNRLATQMYFDGEPLNETDRVLAFALANRTRLIAQLPGSLDREGAALVNWDIVLRDG